MAPAAAGDKSPTEGIVTSPSSWDVWKNQIIVPSLFAGIAGSGVGLVSRHRKMLGVANVSATYATNFAIVTGCYCAAREFTRVSRTDKPDDLFNSAIGGFGSGAILGRLQGGPVAAARYAVIFAVVGTSVDYANIKLKPLLKDYYNSMVGDGEKKQDWLKMPVWSPIRVLDEEELAAKRERENMFRNVQNLNKEET